MEQDVVCGMQVDPAKAAWGANLAGQGNRTDLLAVGSGQHVQRRIAAGDKGLALDDRRRADDRSALNAKGPLFLAVLVQAIKLLVAGAE